LYCCGAAKPYQDGTISRKTVVHLKHLGSEWAPANNRARHLAQSMAIRRNGAGQQPFRHLDINRFM